MPIDPSIALNVKPVQLANPLEQFGQFQQIQQALNQNRLADLVYGEKQREVTQANALNALYRDATNPDGTIDRTKLYGSMAAGGLGSRIPALQKSFLDADHVQAQVDQTKAKTNEAKSKTAGMDFDLTEKKRQKAITDIAALTSPEQAYASLNAHAQAGDLTPEMAEAVRQTIPQNPADFPKWQIGMLQRIMSAKDAAAYTSPDANTVANNKQSDANNRRTVAATVRGQNMIDERQREQIGMGKVPPGYRATPDGNLQAIPGGPADLKLQGALNQDTAALNGSIAGFDRLATAANSLLKHPGLAGITGMRGALPNIPGSSAADAEAQLNTLKSQVAFGVLQDMRNNSKTGGALGSVSDAEGKRLEANLSALEKAQSLDQFKSSLQAIIDYASGAKDRTYAAFNMKHPQAGGPSAPPAPAPTRPQSGAAAPSPRQPTVSNW